MPPPKIQVRSVPRERDDIVLQALRWRVQGYPWPSIAYSLGFKHWQSIQRLCENVMQDDLEFSKEPRSEVLKRY